MPEGPSSSAEALRQQLLLQALWQQQPAPALQAWLRNSSSEQDRGLAAYRGNGLATAVRALAVAYPTLQQLVGTECFEALARQCWQQHPPRRGDLAQFGAELAALIEAEPALTEEPYLADVARLEALVVQCEAAADADEAPGARPAPDSIDACDARDACDAPDARDAPDTATQPAAIAGLELLAHDAAESLQLVLRPGTALLPSRWPVVSIWQAHQAHRRDDDQRFSAVRLAFAAQAAESALVYREGWRAQVEVVDSADLAFTQAVLAGALLGPALAAAAAAAADFSFEAWLLRAVRQQWLIALRFGCLLSAPRPAGAGRPPPPRDA